ncbi:helix-turn-helix domain-containing protein [Brevibacillus sp. B_LB10_24]|uniref:helix-turn-helix domain-containing protein n=1 Tax=Brevibacillus sp. B_LB10_24 TaxID=3380645 RepID=UPI0038B9102A
MDQIHLVLAENIKNLRAMKKLSLDKVAEMTGVSKTMLGQIERGESNPTINTVWKIANGLKISFTELMNRPQPDTVVVTKDDMQTLQGDHGRFRVFPYFPFEEGRRFEVYSVEIDQGGDWRADAHGPGTEEFITVFDGELTVRINDDVYTVKAGESIKFKADKPHAYHNPGDSLTRMSMVIFYP